MTTDLKPYESIVLVRWADAESDSDWRDKDEIQGKVIDDPGYSTHLTVGIFVHQDEGKIIVVQNISQDSFSCFMKIPMGCVQSVEQIGQVKFEATPPVGGIEVKSKSQEKRIAIQKGQGGGA